MQSSTHQVILRIAAAVTIVAASFFLTLKVLDYLQSTEQTNPIPIHEPSYNFAALPRLSLGQTLDFSNGQNGSALLSGWSSPEQSGVWSDGRAAFIGFVVEAGPGVEMPKQAIIRAGIFLVPGIVAKQRIEVWASGKKLAEYDTKTNPAELTIPLGGVNVRNGGPVVLGFYLPDATSPVEARAGQDTRVLALAIVSLQLAP
jgi:hypothetical protein